MPGDIDPFALQVRAVRGGAHRPRPGLDAAAIMRSVGETVYFWDIGSDTLTWGDNAAGLLGVAEDTLSSNRDFAQILCADNLVNRYDTVIGSGHRDPGDGVAYQIEYAICPQSGTTIWVEDVGRWFVGADGKPARAHGVVRVITDRHEREQRLSYISRFDPMTGLANRLHVTEVLEEVVETTRRYRTCGGFLIAAIDHLGELNTSFGYDVADQVILEVSRRLRAEVRTGDCIGRFSGNKFGVVLNNCSEEEMEIAARRLRQVVTEAVVVTAAGPVPVTLSVGGVVFPRAASTAQTVMMCAQEALNQARDRGENGFFAYHRSSERETKRRTNLRMAEEIVRALNDRSLAFALQPIVRAGTGEVVFHEALLRLSTSDGTLTTASHLIEPAERFKLTPLVDRRVLDLAIERLSDDRDLTVSINVSASTAKDMDWIVAFMNATKTVPDFARRIIVEITETAMIGDMTATRAFIDKLHEVNCRVAIDDFGAGYTSFRNLRTLDVDIVKIDGSFINGIHASRDDQVFVRALVGIAQALGIETVAEWVECEADARYLADLGIDYIQGFHYGEPQIATALISTPMAKTA